MSKFLISCESCFLPKTASIKWSTKSYSQEVKLFESGELSVTQKQYGGAFPAEISGPASSRQKLFLVLNQRQSSRVRTCLQVTQIMRTNGYLHVVLVFCLFLAVFVGPGEQVRAEGSLPEEDMTKSLETSSLNGLAKKQAVASTAPVVIPFQWDRNRQPYLIVFARFKGQSQPLPFELDTGGAYSLSISEETVRASGLKATLLSPGTDVNHTDVPVPIINDATLEILGADKQTSIMELAIPRIVQYPNERMPAYSTSQRVAGVIGSSLLQYTKARLDFEHHTITLYPPGATLPPSADSSLATVFPLVATEDAARRPYLGLHYGEGDKNKQERSLNLMIDTGAAISNLRHEDAASLPELTYSVFEDKVNTVAGSFQVQRARKVNFPFGHLVEPNVDFTVMPPNSWVPSVLGTDFLCRFVITFDYLKKQITFERAGNYAEQVRQESGPTEMTLLVKNGDYLIDTIRFGSPAEIAGLRRGDRILRIHDEAVNSSQTTFSAIRSMLNGIAGKEVTVRVSRDNLLKDFSYIPLGYFGTVNSKSGKAVIGFGLAPPDDKGSIHIATIEPDSLAARAGLHVGDEVLALNNIAVKAMPFDDVVALIAHSLHNGSLIFDVRIPGETHPRKITLTIPLDKSLPPP